MRVAFPILLATSIASAEYIREGPRPKPSPADDDGKHGKKKVAFSVEKGVKCSGGGGDFKFGKECEGGMKMEFTKESKPFEIVSTVASGMQDEFANVFVPDEEDLLPPDDIMQKLLVMEEDGLGLEDGFSRSVEFGGMAKMKWGCKVTYSKEKGKFSKNVECGFKGDAGMGKMPEEIALTAEN